MIARIYIKGEIGVDVNLVDVIRQVKSFENYSGLEVVIDSIGGSVSEGDAIYNYLTGIGKEFPVVTIAEKACSIAAKIFAAGSRRIVQDVNDVLMIHFPWATVQGDAEDLEMVASELRKIEKDFVSFYADHLNVDNEAVKNLLYNETFLSGRQAVELGFATELKIPLQAVAKYDVEISKKNKMTTKNENDNSKERTLKEAFFAFFGLDAPKPEPEIKAQLILQDSNGTEIVFPDLEENAAPSIGDSAQIDGVAIPDGSYIMPSLDEATVVFVGGSISEIIPKEEEEEPVDEPKPETVEEPQPEAMISARLDKKIREAEERIQAKFDVKIKEKDEEIKALKAKIGSQEIEPEGKEPAENRKNAGTGSRSADIFNAKFKN